MKRVFQNIFSANRNVSIAIAMFAFYASAIFGVDIPRAINYQGEFTYSSGSSTGGFYFKYELYQTETGGSPVWIQEPATDADSIWCENGLFSDTLGRRIDTVLTKYSTLYIQVSIKDNWSDSWTVLSPREKLLSSPFALTIADSAVSQDKILWDSDASGDADSISAIDIPYDNSASGLDANDMQNATDEVEARVDNIEENYVEISPAAAQTDAGSNPSIFINRTAGTGSLMKLQDSGTTRFSIGLDGSLQNTGNLVVGTGTDEVEIDINSPAASSATVYLQSAGANRWRMKRASSTDNQDFYIERYNAGWSSLLVGDYTTGDLTISNNLVVSGSGQVANLRLVPTGSSPSADEGRIYYDNDAHTFYGQTDAGWVDLASGGSGTFQQLRADGNSWLTDSVILVSGDVNLTQAGDSITFDVKWDTLGVYADTTIVWDTLTNYALLDTLGAYADTTITNAIYDSLGAYLDTTNKFFQQFRADGNSWLTDSITLVSGSNITLAQSGDSITISSTPGGGENLEQTLAIGNSAGAQDIDMNDQKILDADTIETNTILDGEDGILEVGDSLQIDNGLRVLEHSAFGANASYQTNNVLRVQENYTSDGNVYGIYASSRNTATITANRNIYGIEGVARSSLTENGNNANAYGVYGVAYTNASYTFHNLRGGQFTAYSTSDTTSGQDNIIGVGATAYFNDTTGTVQNLRGAFNIAYNRGNNVNNAVGAYNYVYSHNAAVGTINNAYGTYSRVRANDDDSTLSNINNAYGVYSKIDQKSGANQPNNAYLYYGNISTGANRYGLYLTGETNNYISGNLGIGVNPPTSKLQVSGDFRVDGDFYNQEIGYDQSYNSSGTAGTNLRTVSITTHGTGASGSSVLICAGANYEETATLGGWVEIRVLRDGTEIASTKKTTKNNNSYDNIQFTIIDEPSAGSHDYTLEYRDGSGSSNVLGSWLQVAEIKR